MRRKLKLRIDIAAGNASNLLSNDSDKASISEELKTATAHAVRNRIDDRFVITQADGIIVTEIGFVTMALLAEQAIYRNDLLIIPGVDEKNQFGYLVLRNEYLPYHSLAEDIDGAADETYSAHQKAANLLNYYGNTRSLKQAALGAPWYQLSKMEDTVHAGMCRWGTMSFLQRSKLCFIAHHVGLPRILVRLTGGYGNRITAATIRRLQQKRNERTAAVSQIEAPKKKHA